MSERSDNDCANDCDRIDDAVDPRVQIELERLNTATDNINKLEVDLDEARATFRELLCDSTVNIDNLAKKLGSCIDKSRPYYDARFKAKEALRETQKAAIRFERANGQHAAAKEMVYLAEEGLKTEGRCFDHAWQEMLNHATSRVNESEHERALSEAEHRHTTAMYHKAEHNVQRLQRELKRAIAKSSMGARRSLLLINSIAYRHNLLMLPYYEMKAQFNQMLEEQKVRVGLLERSVGEAKMTYAEALRNLEKISDEIHRTRRYHGLDSYPKRREPSKDTKKSGCATVSRTSTESSITGSPDSTDYTSDEYLRLPEKMSPNTSCPVPKTVENEPSSGYLGLSNLNISSTEPRKYIKRERPRSMAAISDTNKSLTTNDSRKTSSSSSRLSDLAKVISPTDKRITIKPPSVESAKMQDTSSKTDEKLDSQKTDNKMAAPNQSGAQNGEEWTEISLNNSPEEIYYNNEVYSDDEDPIPYKPLPSELSPENVGVPGIISTTSSTTVAPKIMAGATMVIREDLNQERRITSMANQQSLPAMMESTESSPDSSDQPGIISTTTTMTMAPKMMAGAVTHVHDDGNRERRKAQLVNQKSMPAMMESNDMTLGDDKKAEVTRSPSVKGRSKLDGSLANWITRSSAAGEASCNSSVNSSRRQSLDMLWSTGTVERAAELLSHGIMMLDIGNLSERFRGEGKNADKSDKGDKVEAKGKKVPSPLEKTMTYLNPDEETSDSESLASVEMLSEDQICSLMMEQDMNQVCQEVLGTPLVEVCPLLQQLQQQQ